MRSLALKFRAISYFFPPSTAERRCAGTSNYPQACLCFISLQWVCVLLNKGQSCSQQVASPLSRRGCGRQRNSNNAIALMVFTCVWNFLLPRFYSVPSLRWFGKRLLYSVHRTMMGCRWGLRLSRLRLPASALCKCQRQLWVGENQGSSAISICMPDQRRR